MFFAVAAASSNTTTLVRTIPAKTVTTRKTRYRMPALRPFLVIKPIIFVLPGSHADEGFNGCVSLSLHLAV